MSRWPVPTVREPSKPQLAAWMRDSYTGGGERDPDLDHECEAECCPHYEDHQNGECEHDDCDHECDSYCYACDHTRCCDECHTHDGDCCSHEHDSDCCDHDPRDCDCQCDGTGNSVTDRVHATDGCETLTDGVCPHGHPSWLLYYGITVR